MNQRLSLLPVGPEFQEFQGEKGKRGEHAWCDELVAQGYNAPRGQQFSGTPDSPDVIGSDLPGFPFEVKTVERLNINEAMAQAVEDAGEKIPG